MYTVIITLPAPPAAPLRLLYRSPFNYQLHRRRELTLLHPVHLSLHCNMYYPPLPPGNIP
jgi:hypothetical protein